ncbi:MAG: polyprenyl synthetase family protein [Chloroflexi bacterium]|nr:polyprenyl synthetase family protein [Chloroflexota bacterium]
MVGSSQQESFARIVADVAAEMLAIRRDQTTIASLFWEVVDYQFGWDLDDPAETQRVSGKKIRPLLMALVAQAISGDYQHVLPAGAALEFLHNFTLIHDDVMDNSVERRHRPAAWTHWGKYQAINVGDGMYALANVAIARLLENATPPRKVALAFRIMSQACLWTAEGQILDMDFETRDRVSPDEYITMITNKSATLIEAAAQIGAVLSTDDDALVERYGRFARYLGIAFQVRDDYLGVWGDEAQTGKSATSDIREKKKSYPVLVGFQRAAGDDLAILQRIYAQDELTDDDIDSVLSILERVDAVAHTDSIAHDYYTGALNELDATGINNSTQDLLRQYAEFLIQRWY